MITPGWCRMMAAYNAVNGTPATVAAHLRELGIDFDKINLIQTDLGRPVGHIVDRRRHPGGLRRLVELDLDRRRFRHRS